uniref:substrate-binding domain-containing protein n=1 Tax=unclassified Variovorax TaxID=663243 RepID=UPI000D4B9593
MKKPASTIARSLALSLLALCTGAFAADLKVLTAGAFKPVVVALAPVFEQRTGHRLSIDNDTAGALQKRIAGGEAFDLVVLTPAAIEQLAAAGQVSAGSAVRLARVAIGVAVKQGAPVPDISSVAAFRQALLDARAVAYIDPAAGGSSGVYLSQLFVKMGIAPQIQAKAVLVPGGLVAQRLVSGEADLAVHQVSEILAVPGATLVGPIPPEVQNYTVYAGAVGAAARDAAAAQAFLALLGSAEARAVLAQKGMEAP